METERYHTMLEQRQFINNKHHQPVKGLNWINTTVKLRAHGTPVTIHQILMQMTSDTDGKLKLLCGVDNKVKMTPVALS